MDQDYADNMPTGGWAASAPHRTMKAPGTMKAPELFPDRTRDLLPELIAERADEVARLLRAYFAGRVRA